MEFNINQAYRNVTIGTATFFAYIFKDYETTNVLKRLMDVLDLDKQQ